MIGTFATVPTSTLEQLHMDPPGPTPSRGDGFILDDMPVEAIDALLSVAGPGVDTSLLLVDLRHLGGAPGRPDPRGGAVDHLPGRFLGMAVGVAPVPELVPVVECDVRRLISTIATWQSLRDYLNFRESDARSDRFFGPEVIERLQLVRARVNDNRVIRSNHEID